MLKREQPASSKQNCVLDQGQSSPYLPHPITRYSQDTKCDTPSFLKGCSCLWILYLLAEIFPGTVQWPKFTLPHSPLPFFFPIAQALPRGLRCLPSYSCQLSSDLSVGVDFYKLVTSLFLPSWLFSNRMPLRLEFSFCFRLSPRAS